MADFEKTTSEFEERVVAINRNSKVVKGGRRFSFAAIVVVGNKNGKVGFGSGKAKEVAEAIRKATEAAHKDIKTVTLRNGTIPHETEIKFSATKVMLRPASPGTGVISGASARAVLELAGVTDILTKTYGSTNPRNVVQATLEGLTSQRTLAEFVKHRNGGK
jgi:small subunit ribosomal protein S5|tara:strand:- start:5194 stop:5679 length:486 start_codon:yes stop_codon:yes gene_type:complete